MMKRGVYRVNGRVTSVVWRGTLAIVYDDNGTTVTYEPITKGPLNGKWGCSSDVAAESFEPVALEGAECEQFQKYLRKLLRRKYPKNIRELDAITLLTCVKQSGMCLNEKVLAGLRQLVEIKITTGPDWLPDVFTRAGD